MELFILILLLNFATVAFGQDINTTTLIQPSAEVPDNDKVSSTTISTLLASSDIPCTDNSSTSCSNSEALICDRDQGICKCAYPSLTFDPLRKKCVAKIGEQCGFFIGLRNESISACPENAVCALANLDMITNDGENHYSVLKCACIYTHYPSENGTCLPLAEFGEECGPHLKCRPDTDLTCINGKCDCQFGTDQFYDQELKTCVSYAGGNCSRICVQNAACDFWGSGTCQCRVDHRKKDRFCEPIPPGYLSPCLIQGETNQEICNADQGLKCIDKVCQCGNPLHQVYDFQQELCIGLAGDFCSPNVSGCVKNAKCLKQKGGKDSSIHSCQCDSSYSTTPFRKCMKSFGAPCSSEFCNVYRGLACVNGSCLCYDSFLKWDPSKEACLARNGSPCGKVFLPFPGDWVKKSCPDCDSYFFDCEAGSTCTRDFSSSQGNELVGPLEKFRCKVDGT